MLIFFVWHPGLTPAFFALHAMYDEKKIQTLGFLNSHYLLNANRLLYSFYIFFFKHTLNLLNIDKLLKQLLLSEM